MKYLFSNGRLRPVEANNASTMMQAFNYGTAAFEGMKAYYHPAAKNWFLFRPDEHYRRLKLSAEKLDCGFDLSQAEFIKILSKLIRKNSVREDIYLRPLVYRDTKGIGLTRPSGFGFSVFAQALPQRRPRRWSCGLVTQRRPTDGTYSVKLAGNYLLSFFAQQEAARKRCDIGLLLSSDGYLSEGSLMNLFFARDGKIYTPSLSCGALAGITRKTIISLAQDKLGLKVYEGKYRLKKLYEADEAFLTGTGSGLNYIKQVDDHQFELGGSDQLAARLWRAYRRITRGQDPKYNDWLVPVT